MLCVAVGMSPALTVGPLLAVAAQAALHGAPGAPLPDVHAGDLARLEPAAGDERASALAGGVAAVLRPAAAASTCTGWCGLPGWIAQRRPRGLRWLAATAPCAGARALTGALRHAAACSATCSLLVADRACWPALAARLASAPARLARPRAGRRRRFGVVAVGADRRWRARWRHACCPPAAAAGADAARRRRAGGVAWPFVWLSAPDLALTQLLVEMVTIVLMMLALHWLPRERRAGAGDRCARAGATRDAGAGRRPGRGRAGLRWC
ncbi:MAG: DUF4040 domain-containing protein [Comamonadaceae bacterium]|nr:DUF4040 domain-containing protein [Comamonadaceae bacterium]